MRDEVISAASTQLATEQAKDDSTLSPTELQTKQDNIAKLETAVSERVTQNPTSFATNNTASSFYLQKGDQKRAEDLADKALALAQAQGKPALEARALVNRGLARLARDASPESREAAHKDGCGALKLDPASRPALELCKYTEQYASLDAKTEKWLKQNSQNMQELSRRFSALQNPSISHTVEEYEARCNAQPTKACDLVYKVIASRKAGDLPAARGFAEAAVSASPDDPMAYFQRGRLREDAKLGRKVAIKKLRAYLRADPKERERFMSEARTVAGLNHPNIVKLYDVVEEGGELYLIFEHVKGRTIDEVIESYGKLKAPEALRFLKACCAAVDYAHGQGVLHRDLMPGNVMLAGKDEVKVMDFGIAHVLGPDGLLSQSISGTPPYMSPEQQVNRHIGKESDLYSLGVMAYEMLIGAMPFGQRPEGIYDRKMQRDFAAASQRNPELPKAVDEFFQKALEPEPEKRFHSAAAFLEALEQALAGKVIA